MKKRLLNLLLCLVCLGSCSKNDEPADFPLQYQEIAKGTLSSNKIFPQQDLVISTAEEWDALILSMQQVNDNVLHFFSETEINFNKYQVLAIFDEVKPHTGHYIFISDIKENQRAIEVKVGYGSTEMGFTALSQPFYIVKIEKLFNPVIFL